MLSTRPPIGCDVRSRHSEGPVGHTLGCGDPISHLGVLDGDPAGGTGAALLMEQKTTLQAATQENRGALSSRWTGETVSTFSSLFPPTSPPSAVQSTYPARVHDGIFPASQASVYEFSGSVGPRQVPRQLTLSTDLQHQRVEQ
eukprot:superscaffoldBa00005505_g20427